MFPDTAKKAGKNGSKKKYQSGQPHEVKVEKVKNSKTTRIF
jgi:hypothetical protein